MLPRKIFKNFLISFQAEECLLFLLRLRRLLPSRAAADRLPATAEKRAAAANLTEAAAAAAVATSRRKNLRGRPKLWRRLLRQKQEKGPKGQSPDLTLL